MRPSRECWTNKARHLPDNITLVFFFYYYNIFIYTRRRCAKIRRIHYIFIIGFFECQTGNAPSINLLRRFPYGNNRKLCEISMEILKRRDARPIRAFFRRISRFFFRNARIKTNPRGCVRERQTHSREEPVSVAKVATIALTNLRIKFTPLSRRGGQQV